MIVVKKPTPFMETPSPALAPGDRNAAHAVHGVVRRVSVCLL
jgi:hypothetical protein